MFSICCLRANSAVFDAKQERRLGLPTLRNGWLSPKCKRAVGMLVFPRFSEKRGWKRRPILRLLHDRSWESVVGSQLDNQVSAAEPSVHEL